MPKNQGIGSQSVAYRNLKKVAHPVVKIEAEAAKTGADAVSKAKIHLYFAVSGIILSFGLSFIDVPIMVHASYIVVGLPGAGQVVLDWIKRW